MITAAALVAAVGAPANASVAQPAVVSENPVDYTPDLVPTTRARHPHADAIDVTGGTAYVGGRFNDVSDSTGKTQYAEKNFVAFDVDTGAVQTSIAATFNGTVWAVEATRRGIYVGGAFTKVNGSSDPALVKLSPTTGKIMRSFDAHFVHGQINQIQLVNGQLFVAGSAGTKLMALDPMTGADVGTFSNLPITGAIPHARGNVSVFHFAINSGATRLVATGNFESVGSASRTRLFVADLPSKPGGTASLDPWYYTGFAKPCSSTEARRIAYLQDVDFSPTGNEFTVTATGNVPLHTNEIWHQGASNPPGTMVCDGAGRFSLSNGDSTHQPLWINYTGGDSIWSDADTGAAVYVMGHFQWLDNPDGRGSHGVGNAVQRYGVGAIDPQTGLALSWNPPVPSSMGGKQFLPTSTGLWAVSDSHSFDKESHFGIAYVPLP